MFLQLFQDRFYSLTTQRVMSVCGIQCNAATRICRVKGEGMGRASHTRRRRPAAYLLTFPQDFLLKQKKFTRAYQDIALRIYYLHCVSPF